MDRKSRLRKLLRKQTDGIVYSDHMDRDGDLVFEHACRFADGEELLRETQHLLGVGPGETTPDGAFSLEASSDVGAGAIAPAVRIDTLVYGPLTPEHLGHLIGGVVFGTLVGSAMGSLLLWMLRRFTPKEARS